MRTYLWLIFAGLATLSVLPLARLDFFNTHKKYRYFKYLSLVMSGWTMFNYLKFVSLSARVVYYSTLSVYPLVFLLTILIFISMLNYLGKKINIFFLIGAGIFFLVDLVMSYTNTLHLLVLELPYSTSLNYAIISEAKHGIFFYIHTAVCYVILLLAMGSIAIRLYKNLRNERDVFPFVIMIIGIVMGLAANVTHLFFYDFPIDPTYIMLIVLTTLLYFIFYIRDIRLMFKVNGNDFILNNLREMYLLVNHRDIIVAASPELEDKFKMKIEEKMGFPEFIKSISDKAIVYTDNKKVENTFDENKLYFHMMEKHINLPFLKHSGKFYLFYDETQNRKYLYDLNYVMTHDLMTNIYNRNYFESLEPEIEAKYENYSLIMFDIDGLKQFNDYLGHEAGDQLLIRFADALKVVVNKYKNLIPIRMGGDEFLLIAIHKDKNDLEEILYDLKILTNDKDLLKHVGFSYGYSQNNYANKSFNKVMTEADANQYAMKASRKKAKDELENYLKLITQI